MMSDEQKQTFIEKITPIVQKCADEYGYNQEVVPAIVAQACYESNYGNSALSTSGNNYFGIKYGDYYNGPEVHYNENSWRAYDSLEDGVEGYFKFLEQPDVTQYYSDRLKPVTDPKLYLTYIGGAGYGGGSYGERTYYLMKDEEIDNYCEEHPYSAISTFSEENILEDKAVVDEEDKRDEESTSKEKVAPLQAIITEPLEAIISVEYQVVRDHVKAITGAIKKNNLLTSNNASIPEDGSQTFNAANKAYNTYMIMNESFLASLDMACKNIMSVAEFMSREDAKLAASASGVNRYLNIITGLELDTYRNFYNNPPSLKITDVSGDIKLSKAKLMEASSTGNALISNLLQDINDTRTIQKEIDDLVDSTKESLQGRAWNTIRKKMDEYSEICQEKQEYANRLVDSMIESYKQLLAYMKYDELDTSKIPETKDQVTQLTIQLQQLKEDLEKEPLIVKVYAGTDSNGKVLYKEENNSMIPKLKAAIELCEQLLTEAKDYLDQLEGLKDVDNRAAGGIRDVQNSQPVIDKEKEVSFIDGNINNSSDLEVKDLDNRVDNNTNNVSNINNNSNNNNNVSNIVNNLDNKNSNNTSNNNEDKNKDENTNLDNSSNDEDTGTDKINVDANKGEYINPNGNVKREDSTNNTSNNANNATNNNTNNNTNSNVKDNNGISDNTNTNIDSKDNDIDNNTNTSTSNASNIFKTVGVGLGGLGLAGAAAYGAKKYMDKQNENKDVKQDYYEDKSESNSSVDDTDLNDFE